MLTEDQITAQKWWQSLKPTERLDLIFKHFKDHWRGLSMQVMEVWRKETNHIETPSMKYKTWLDKTIGKEFVRQSDSEVFNRTDVWFETKPLERLLILEGTSKLFLMREKPEFENGVLKEKIAEELFKNVGE